jgi:SLT domain-containing protein/phage-related protein
MAGAFRIAEGYVEVTADREAYDRTLDRLKTERNTVKIGVDVDTRVAADELDNLTRTRLASIKLKVDEAALSKLKIEDRTLTVLPEISDAAKERVTKALDKLTADRVVRIRADVDTRVGAAEIRNLIQRRTARIGVDVDTRVAAADLANLTRARTVNVNANARAGDARLQLDRLARDRHMNIDVGVGGGGAAGGLSVLSSSMSKLAAAAIGALPTLASLGESLIQMGPAAALAVPAVLALGSAFAAIKIGTSGVSDAFKAAFQPAVKGASAALSGTKAVETAQRSLAKAVQAEKDAETNAAAARVQAARAVADAQQNLKNTYRDVADANHQAAESVAAAERDLANAQRAARQAQLDLTQARKDAAMSLEDLNNSLVDSQLAQKQDALNLQDAEAKLAADRAAGLDQSSEQYQKDQLARDQAAQALKEQTTQTQRLQDQADEANKKGVEGSDQVTAAKQGIADANQTVKDSEQNLADAQAASAKAQTDGLQQIAKAQRDLADAQAAQVKAATDGARQIADAQQAVADAANAVGEAQQSAALKTGGLAEAMSRLSPQAQAFVGAVVALRGAWTALRLDVQDRLFQGLAGTLAGMAAAALPSLRTGLVGTAGVLNAMAKNAANAVTSLGKAGTLKSMFAGLNGSLAPLSRIPGQFITALVQLSVAAAPAFTRLTTAVGNVATTISQKLSAAFKSGALSDAINTAVGVAKQFGRLLGDIFGTVGNVMKAAAAGGGDALGALGAVFKELRKVTAMPEVQKALTSIFKVINQIATLLAGTLGKALGQLVMGLAPVADAIGQVLSSLGDTGPLMAGLIAAFNPFLGILTLVAPLIGQLAKPIVGLVKSLAPLLNTLSSFASGLMTALAPVVGALIDVLSGVLQAVAPVLARIAPVILNVVKAMAGPLAQVIRALIPAIGPLLTMLTTMDLAMLPLAPQLMKLIPPIAQLTVALLNLAVQVLTPLLPLITGLAVLLSTVLSGALMILVPVINTVVGWITVFTNAITASVKWIVDKFTELYDILVGHSIIPDLVTAIIGWFTFLWTEAKRIFTTMMNGIVTIWKAIWSGLRNGWNGFWSGLQGAWNSAWSWARNSFNSLRTGLSSTWSGLWNGIKSTFTSIIGTVSSKITDFANGTKKAFSSLRDALGTIWNGIKEKFAAPVRFTVGTVYNNGIRKMWDTIASKVGLPQLPEIKLGFNTGGVVPGDGRRDTVPAMLTPGERILSLSQVAKLGGHAAIDAMVGRSDKHGPKYGIGGIVSGIGGAASGVVSGVTGALGSAADWAKNLAVGGLQAAAKKAISAVVNPLINKIPGQGPIGDLMKGVPKTILSGILGVLGKKDKDATSSGQISYKPGAGVAQWASTILKALSLLGQSPSWLGTVERRMNQESGGNPTVVNRWDSNWTAGTPSVGLMQVIGPTFRSHAGPFGKTGPFMYGTSVNPLANTFAGLHYAIGRYGSLSALNRPGGYDSGGLLQPGATMAVNRTGRPERVLNADHTAKLDALLTAGGGGITIQAVNVNGTFDFSSPTDRRRAANELVEEMKEALRNLENSRQRGGRRR